MAHHHSHSRTGYVSPWYSDAESLLHDVRPGDALEFDRIFYLHWGIYVGEVEIEGKRSHCVIHASNFPDENITQALAKTKKNDTKFGLVQCQPIEDILMGYRVRINNSMDENVRPHCTKEIVKRAFAAIEEYDEYDLLSNNCEHFVNWCRNGVKKSRQVEDFFIYSNSINSSGLAIIISLFLNAQIAVSK